MRNTGANDKGWKKRYVFVDKASLGKEYAFLYDDRNTEGILLIFCEFVLACEFCRF